MSDETKPSLVVKLGVAGAGLSVFVAVTSLTNSDIGAATAFGFVAVVVAAYATWHLRDRPFYWPTLILFSAAHIAALLWWHAIIPSPAIKVAPVVVLDFVSMVLLLFGLERATAGEGR